MKALSALPLMLGLTLLLMLVLSACETTDLDRDHARALMEAKLADVLIQSGQVQEIVVSADLSEAEMRTVTESLEIYQAFRDKWKERDTRTVAVGVATLIHDYHRLHQAYLEVEMVVSDHWEEYTDAQKVALISYRQRARRIHEASTELINGQDFQQAVNRAVELGLLAAQLAVL